MEVNLASLARHFSDENAAYRLVESMRWKNGPVCPHCGDTGRAYFLKPRGDERQTSTGRKSARRLWKCKACRRQFSVLVGTIFHNSKVPLSKWLLAVYLMSASKNGVAAFELHRTLGVTNKTAWFMCHRIREAMQKQPLAAMFSGNIVADETFIGGNPKNQHRQGTNRPYAFGKANRPVRGGYTHLQPVLSLVNRETGEVRSRVVADVTAATLGKAIAEQVDMTNTRLLTDASSSYRAIRREFAAHESVDHARREYVRGDVTTNPAEGYFSQLKRSLDGTHHRVSREHLQRYLHEFDFRYSTRKMTDSARMAVLMDRTGGRRLTYRAVAS